jgi:hypothetical protein
MNIRIQRKRTEGWKMPANTVYVGRRSRWGNPFKIGIDGDRDEVIRKYRTWLTEKIRKHPDFLVPLYGKDLCCWCRTDEHCHADVLLEMCKPR